MTDLEIKELVERAMFATPGPWEYYLEQGYEGHGVVITFKVHADGFHRIIGDCVFKKIYTSEENKMYLAAANPTAILSLIDRLKECESALKFFYNDQCIDPATEYFDKWRQG